MIAESWAIFQEYQIERQWSIIPVKVRKGAEVLSPGAANERRDREVKLGLYSRRGVLEYWIVNWQERYIEVYRREQAVLKLHNTLYENDVLESPHLPGFRCLMSEIFADVF